MLVCPGEGVGVVAFVNAASKTAHEVADKLTRVLLDVPASAPRLPHAGVLESSYLWPELRGFYGPEGPLNTDLRLWSAYAGSSRFALRTSTSSCAPSVRQKAPNCRGCTAPH